MMASELPDSQDSQDSQDFFSRVNPDNLVNPVAIAPHYFDALAPALISPAACKARLPLI
jgi:hypothetical protein